MPVWLLEIRTASSPIHHGGGRPLLYSLLVVLKWGRGPPLKYLIVQTTINNLHNNIQSPEVRPARRARVFRGAPSAHCSGAEQVAVLVLLRWAVK